MRTISQHEDGEPANDGKGRCHEHHQLPWQGRTSGPNAMRQSSAECEHANQQT